MGSRRARKWERRSDARPAELTAAALRMFAERGFAATRLEDVAASAGVTKGTIYLYFKSKEELFEAVVRETVAPRLDLAHALIETFEGPTPHLVRLLFGVFEGALAGPLPSVIKLVVSESANFPKLARLWSQLATGRVLELVGRVLQRGIERGEFRPVDPPTMAPVVVAPILLLGLWKQSLGLHGDITMDARAVLAAHVENLLRGLAPPKSDRGSRREER